MPPALREELLGRSAAIRRPTRRVFIRLSIPGLSYSTPSSPRRTATVAVLVLVMIPLIVVMGLLRPPRCSSAVFLDAAKGRHRGDLAARRSG